MSGQLQGQGNATLLLNACIDDCRAKGKTGLAVLSSPKKRPFLSDPDYLRRRGFTVADRAAPWFELLWLPLKPDAAPPRFSPSVRGRGLSFITAINAPIPPNMCRWSAPWPRPRECRFRKCS